MPRIQRPVIYRPRDDLRRELRCRGLTQVQVAGRMGIDAGRLRRRLSGEAAITQEFAYGFSRATGIAVADVVRPPA